MLRPSPTCISLSSQDVSFHLQQIDIYHGLLKQGFKKKDIIRYFKEHQEANASPSPEFEAAIEPALTMVELAVRSPLSSAESTSTDAPQSTDDGCKDEDATQEAEKAEFTSPSGAPKQPVHRHAPRQSSLLRFAKAISSDSTTRSDETEHGNTLSVPVSKTYRPRSETYSYNQSELSESELIDGIQDLHIGLVNREDASIIVSQQRSASPMRPEAETFIPRLSHQPTTAEPDFSQSLLQQDRDQRTSPATTHLLQVEAIPHRSSLRPTSGNRGSSANDSSPTIEFPSSPPSPRYHSQQSETSATLHPSYITTTPTRRSLRDARSEPRSHGPQYLDGSFAVYNDALPASTQPQTPADLVRHAIITEHEAAYTAPVGMVHSPTRSRSYRTITTQIEPAEQSPTARAMGMRERRARELMRGVRAEGLRLERLRRRDRERFTSGIDGDDEWRRERLNGRDRDGPGPAMVQEQWRDDLEGDRVGDENWEGETEALGTLGGTADARTGIRVTSGNANAGRGLWEDRDAL